MPAEPSGHPYLAEHKPWGLAEVAKYCQVERPTADRWRTRKVIPGSDGEASGNPWWWPETIIRWADTTGRRPIYGHLWSYTATTLAWSGSSGTIQALDQAAAEASVTAWVRRGMGPIGGFDDDHEVLLVRVWDADWAMPRLPKGTALEAWTWVPETMEHAGRQAWLPAVTRADVRDGDNAVLVQLLDPPVSRDGLPVQPIRHLKWHCLRYPGEDITLAGGAAPESEPQRPRELELWAQYTPELWQAVYAVDWGDSRPRSFTSWWGASYTDRPNSHRLRQGRWPNADSYITALRDYLTAELDGADEERAEVVSRALDLAVSGSVTLIRV